MGEIDPFPFTLARTLGMTLGELDARMTEVEFEEWKNYYRYLAWEAERHGGGR